MENMENMENIEDAFRERERDRGTADRTRSCRGEDSTADAGRRFLMALLVEDNPRVQTFSRALIVRAFAPRDVNVAVASSAEDAIVLLRSFRFDCVISDYDLGGSTGGQVLEHVRRQLPDMLDRFVFFSGSEEPDRILPGRTIDKGVSPDRFALDLRRMLPEVLVESP